MNEQRPGSPQPVPSSELVTTLTERTTLATTLANPDITLVKAAGKRKSNRGVPLEQRFWEKVEKTDGCWLWVGSRDGNGYGLIRNGRLVKAHRLSYEMHKGEIPDGMEIDHLCRVKACVNPAHLEAVTHRENMSRCPDTAQARLARRTHCKRGHEFTPENTYPVPSGGRACRACKALWARRNKESARGH